MFRPNKLSPAITKHNLTPFPHLTDKHFPRRFEEREGELWSDLDDNAKMDGCCPVKRQL